MGQVKLDRAVGRADQEEIVKNLYWVDARVERVEFDPADERTIRFRYRDDSEPIELASRLKEVADRLARSIHQVPCKVRYRSSPRSLPGARAPYEQLVRKGWVKPVTKGAHVYAGLMSDLYHAFDAEFRRQGLALGAEEYRFPSLVDLETLRRAGYLGSFPHQVNFLCHLPEEQKAIERFQASVLSEGGLQSTALDDAMAPPSAAMSPAVCYHFYNLHQGQVVPAGGLAATAVSPCFRFEGKPTTGLRRLREFTMREIIFIGAADEVAVARERLMDCMVRMLELSELQSVLQTASDPFFLNTYDKKRLFQMSFDLKYEAQAYLPDDDVFLAIGSVNDHQDHFGRAFEITCSTGEPAHSCCLGFGLDRWCMAVFAQYGLDPERLPAGVKEMLESEPRASARANVRAG